MLVAAQSKLVLLWWQAQVTQRRARARARVSQILVQPLLVLPQVQMQAQRSVVWKLHPTCPSGAA